MMLLICHLLQVSDASNVQPQVTATGGICVGASAVAPQEPSNTKNNGRKKARTAQLSSPPKKKARTKRGHKTKGKENQTPMSDNTSPPPVSAATATTIGNLALQTELTVRFPRIIECCWLFLPAFSLTSSHIMVSCSIVVVSHIYSDLLLLHTNYVAGRYLTPYSLRRAKNGKIL
jgi:hypothetical protein